MNTKYETPDLRMILLCKEDVITTSLTLGEGVEKDETWPENPWSQGGNA